MRILPALATMAATAAVLAATVTPAHAETVMRTDPRGDTSFTNPSASAGPLSDTVDIVGLKGAYRTSALTFRLTVADLAGSRTFDELAAEIRIRNLGSREFSAVLTAQGGQPEVFLSDSAGGVDCDGLAGRVVVDRDQLVVTVPRSCIRNPGSVRFGAAMSTFGNDGGGLTDVYDDARRNGGSGGTEIKLGKRQLARG